MTYKESFNQYYTKVMDCVFKGFTVNRPAVMEDGGTGQKLLEERDKEMFLLGVSMVFETGDLCPECYPLADGIPISLSDIEDRSRNGSDCWLCEGGSIPTSDGLWKKYRDQEEEAVHTPKA